MSDYLSLEEAAAKLGIPAERLVDLRSQGQVRGFRDGASWKFPENEIDRLADDLAAEGEGSGILVDESGLGSSVGTGSGNVIGGDLLVRNNMELRYLVRPNVAVHTFFDSGTVYLQDETVSIDDLRYSAGVGAQYISPIGPIGFDVGFPLDEKSGEFKRP